MKKDYKALLDLQAIEIDYVKAQIDIDHRTAVRCGVFGIIALIALSAHAVISHNRTIKLHEELSLMQCQSEAEKVSMSFSFTADGYESECAIGR